MLAQTSSRIWSRWCRCQAGCERRYLQGGYDPCGAYVLRPDRHRPHEHWSPVRIPIMACSLRMFQLVLQVCPSSDLSSRVDISVPSRHVLVFAQVCNGVGVSDAARRRDLVLRAVCRALPQAQAQQAALWGRSVLHGARHTCSRIREKALLARSKLMDVTSSI